MNCPSRTDNTLENPGWNQNPAPYSPDTTTRNDFNGIANSRVHRKNAAGSGGAMGEDTLSIDPRPHSRHDSDPGIEKVPDGEVTAAASECKHEAPSRPSDSPRRPVKEYISSSALHCARSLAKFGRFIGPGFLIAVAYIDPGNYSTDVAAGAQFRYALLFIVLVSNLFAILLQSLCVKLGTVTGLNLAENYRAHLPRWLVYCLYVLAEAAIIATDIAEVCGNIIRSKVQDHTLTNITGHWLSNCTKSPLKHPLGGRLCHHLGGCLLLTPLLAS